MLTLQDFLADKYECSEDKVLQYLRSDIKFKEKNIAEYEKIGKLTHEDVAVMWRADVRQLKEYECILLKNDIS